MKPAKPALLVSTFTLAICLTPTVGWSTRAYPTIVTGEVTAAPQSGQIEIAPHLYHAMPNSAADKAVSTFSAVKSMMVR
jgi:hypothetical protein